MLDVQSKLRPPAPEPRTKPLGPIALLRVLASNPLEAWTEAHFEEPLVMGGFSFGRVAVVNEPAAIRHILLDNAANYRKDWLQRRVLSAGLTQGLLTAEGPQWRTQRRALAPLFALKSVMSFADVMRDTARGLVHRLAERDGTVVDIAVEMTRITLEVMIQTMFSDGFDCDPEEIRTNMQTYFETIGRIDPLDVVGVPDFVPRLRQRKVRPALKFFNAAIDRIIVRRRRQLALGEGPRDILTLLLQAQDPATGEKLSEPEVRANVLTFIAAGHETTANCLTWSLFLLSRSPEWCRRVQAEADRVFDDADATTLADRLIETRAAIDEANRLYPPITAISRSAIEADELAGHAIKGGTLVVIAPYVLHRHRALWREPDRFDPRRFLPDEKDKIDRYAYLPFGVGPRICIGAPFALQEAAIVLASIMRAFDIEPVDGHAVWPVQKVTLRPHGGLPLTIRSRGQTSRKST